MGSGSRPAFDRLLDDAEDVLAPCIAHVDAHTIAEAHEGRDGRPALDGLVHADFGDAAVAHAAIADAGAVQPPLLVGYRARTDDRPGRQPACAGGVRDQLRETEGQILPRIREAE